MRKRSIVMCFLTLFMVLPVGCGASENAGSEKAESENVVTSDTEAITESMEESKAHEHEYIYQFTEDGYHDKICAECGDIVHESCTFDEEYRCTLCGNVHEHDYMVTSNENNTHSYTCKAEWCGYVKVEDCAFDENQQCVECGYEHKHIIEYYEKEDYKYYAKCTCEGCGYEEFAWEIEAERVDLSTPTSEGTYTYSSTWRNQDYYLTADSAVYDIPSEKGNIIGSISRDTKVTVTGRVWKCFGEQSSFYSFWALSDGTYIPGTAGDGLSVSLCKSNQIQVHKSPDGYNSSYWYDPKTLYNIYGSIDEALISITGHDLSWFKTNGTARTDFQGQLYYDVVLGKDGIETIMGTVMSDGSWLRWYGDIYDIGGQ